MNVRILSKDNQSLAQENAVLRNEVNTLKEQLALLQEQFDWLKKQVFGRKTEQTSVIMDDCTASTVSGRNEASCFCSRKDDHRF